MMMNRRLIGTVKESRKYIAVNVALQWMALAANSMLMFSVADLLQRMYAGTGGGGRSDKMNMIFLMATAIAVRFMCAVLSSRMSYLSAKAVKGKLREMIYSKLVRLGPSYKEQVSTSEIVQVAVEGVDQLETYFGAYLPQFFYAMLAPLTLFFVLGFVNLPAAVVLLICVPLIPVTIIVIQRWAKRLLGKYWDQYTSLGDTFLENLQGLTTTKIYQSDGFKQQEMREQSERFRRITMKVLTMQLNSITIMDLVAYGGTAAGVILSVLQLRAGRIELAGCLLTILLAAEFFLPMRLLGSFFHIAMNGMAASEKIFRLMDLPEPKRQTGIAQESNETTVHEPHSAAMEEPGMICCNNLRYGYTAQREILHGVKMTFPEGSFTAIVGESGCGKSTLASILAGRNKGYQGRVMLAGIPLSEISEASLMKDITYISHQSYLFKGTVRENLLMASPEAEDVALWDVLEQVRLAEFLRAEEGLDTHLQERASNLSGGQRQRLALARALLHDSPVYIFDEATSNIDVESENDIMEQIYKLSETKTVILISHRLANAVPADRIYVMKEGNVAGSGTHQELLASCPVYRELWGIQQELENYTKEVRGNEDRWS